MIGIRTVFCHCNVEIGTKFQFLGNPIIWEKISEFSAIAWDNPYASFDEPAKEITVIGPKANFRTDAIIDIWEV